MLTQNEITALSLSPTKKDFVQIWNELLEVAGKLSERWDPTSTNESDPGIVLLKALTGIADKLNYNIDKNILEAFMPTAAQEDSMRKLCEMLGYNMKYYRSAETEVTVRYYNREPSAEETAVMKAPGLLIPKFTVLTNNDKDISYFTLGTESEYYYISSEAPVVRIPCMEGQIVKCESNNDNNVITANQISTNNRFYLPETRIAENGIFVYNVATRIDTANLVDGERWAKVDNLNLHSRDSRVFKFGFDSYSSRPYVEFPEDYSKLFKDGIFIYYARTNGVNGNISPRTLTQIELPTTGEWEAVSTDSFSAENIFAATTGANAETIEQAYTGFKKTIGTFETLVTCRDYMNKIYSFIENGKPLVSNILVTDIRNDLNRAVTICSCDDAGIYFKDTPLISNRSVTSTSDPIIGEYTDTVYSEPVVEETYVASAVNKPVYFGNVPNDTQYGDITNGINSITRNAYWHLGDSSGLPIFNDRFSRDFVADITFNDADGGEVSEYNADGTRSDYWLITQNGTTYTTTLPIAWAVNTKVVQTETISTERTVTLEREIVKERAIDNFDIVFYPYKSYNQIQSNVKDIKAVYDASFNYIEGATLNAIKQRLEADGIKTVSHNIRTPIIGDILSINNYLRLNATIATNSKVTADEGALIIDNIKKALANAFNMRELDFGAEIPFDSIVSVIENADTRIKVASLNEPALYTTFSVLEGMRNNAPVVAEYAVASDWLDAEMESKMDRLTKTITITDENGRRKQKSISTFDTAEARKLYNKLAVRNVLAGRVPLFNYNKSFATSFSESIYYVTNKLNVRPNYLAEPTPEEPYSIWTADGIVYTGQYDAENNKPIYTATAPAYADNLIAEVIDDNGDADNYITEIKANCDILADNAGKISDVTLADGEFVQFRAPSFTTVKTYPAYVNYYLDLGEEWQSEAVPAMAKSLFEILNSDRNTWADNQNIRWQRVLDYFDGQTDAQEEPYKKVVTLTQTVAAHGTHTESDSGSTDYTVESLMTLGGCVKFAYRIAWTPSTEEKAPTSSSPLDEVTKLLSAVLARYENPFITSISDVYNLKQSISDEIALHIDMLPEECKQCSFTIYLDFEGVPFEAKSLNAWAGFVKCCIENKPDDSYKYQILDFVPYDEDDTVFWRLFDEGYQEGKYITPDTKKLLQFNKKYFDLLAENASNLHGIYLIENVGADAEPRIILNNEEYQLRTGERLYIEYTPSATAEDGTAKELAAITEVYSEGTIIRPSGFESGLRDSATVESTSYKTVTFTPADGNPVTKKMQRFGASEQVEIRDFARVTLSSDTFSSIYVYKNFNGCPELEKVNGNDGCRTYTLKDGEAIFYTDQNKLEFAYFTTGTEVTLTGNVTIGEFDIIELATILDAGIDVIPWARKTLGIKDKIIFQEFQYITLGAEDKIDSLELIDPLTKPGNEAPKKYLNDTWKFCEYARYSTAADPETKIELPAVRVQANREGCGWEVSSRLELDVSAGIAQSLRKTNNVETYLTLSRTKTDGGDEPVEDIIAPISSEFITDGEATPLLFKTNLACQACGNKITIDKVWSNPDNIKSFQLKIFAEDKPCIVHTKPSTVMPYGDVKDFAKWPAADELPAKDYLDHWQPVNLESITAASGAEDYDCALRLPISLLPNTYGVFSIFIDYASTEAKTSAKTWIEVLPGTRANDITLLNVEKADVEYQIRNNKKSLQRIYLNPGINCVRVNTNSKIFIKSSFAAAADATGKAIDEVIGMLYFDTIRLVDTKQIQYISNSQEDRASVISTQGLNLTQLGYLNTTDAAVGLSPSARTKLQTTFVEEMLEAVQEITQESYAKFYDKYEQLLAFRPKLRMLVEAEQRLTAEQATIARLDTTRREALIKKYKELYTTLEQEKSLLAALNSNAGTDELEQKLIMLLDSFGSTETEKQRILESFYSLRAEALSGAEKVTPDELIEDFQAQVAEEKNKILAKVRTTVANSIEARYQERLAAISAALDTAANSAGKNTLTTILAELKATVTEPTRTLLQSKVNELSSIVENDIDAMIEGITEAAYQSEAPDYSRLTVLLSQLRNIIDSSKVKVLLSEIASAVSESNDAQLKALLATLFDASGNIIETELDKLLNDAALDNTGDTIVDLIDDAIEIAKAATNATIMKEAVDDLAEAITEEYKNRLRTILSAINGLFSELLRKTRSIDAVLADLALAEYTESQTSGSQIQLLIEQLYEAISERNKFILGTKDAAGTIIAYGFNGFNNFSNYDQNTCAEFIREAIKSIWPSYFATTISATLDGYYSVFAKAFTSSLIGFSKLELALPKSELARAVLNVDAFKTLLSEVRPMLEAAEQNTKNMLLVESVSGLLLDSDALRKALTDSENSGNIVISNLIKDWQKAKDENDVKQKQRVQADLKEELIGALSTAEQLFNIISSTLCPALTELLSNKEIISDAESSDNNAFYKKLYRKLLAVQSNIMDGFASAVPIVDDSTYLNLLELPLPEFEAMLPKFTILSDTLLPSVCIATLSSAIDVHVDEYTKQLSDAEVLREEELVEKSCEELLPLIDELKDQLVREEFERFCNKVRLELDQFSVVDNESASAVAILTMEDQLLSEIRAIDVNREFYYNAPLAQSLMIEFNESSSDFNTLMNPQMFYDVNNVNNSFVISKLDIDFLDDGIKIARSSRLN